MNFGSHMSISGGIHKAVIRGKETGCDCIQIFTKNSNQWYAKEYATDEISLFKKLRDEYEINPIIAHASYLINLASPDDSLYEKSINSFYEELTRADLLDIPFIVIHPGSHRGSGEKEGLQKVALAIDAIYEKGVNLKVQILLETTAGQGTNLGYKFEQIAEIIDETKEKKKVGVCFDTAHSFCAGYDIRAPLSYKETFNQFEKTIGAGKIKAIHLNDAKKGLGTRIDRHEHIGKGEIGLMGLKNLVNDERFEHIPMILETPKDKEMKWDKMNLKTLRELAVK